MYRGKSITELRNMLDSGEVTAEELFNSANRLAHYFQEDYNSFVTIVDKFKYKDRDSLINGIPYALKDNFSTSGILTTASSNILKDYVPVYDATVYKKLKKAGAVLVESPWCGLSGHRLHLWWIYPPDGTRQGRLLSRLG